MSAIPKKDINRLRVAFTKADRSPITSLDFHYNGDLLVTTCRDSLKILELREHKIEERVFAERDFQQKYKIQIVKFFDDQHVIHTGAYDHKPRVFNFEENKYIHCYEGHTDEIISLAVSSDKIFTGSKDKTVRMWTANKPRMVSTIQLPDAPLVTSFGEKLLAVAYNSSVIEIYDVRNLKDCAQRYHYIKREEWTGIQFSPDGKMLMITTNSTYILIVSSSEKLELHELTGFKNPDGIHLDAAFSLDSNFVVGGSADGRLNIWNLERLTLRQIKSGFVGACERVAFNPAYLNVATTSNSNVLHLWIKKDDHLN